MTETISELIDNRGAPERRQELFDHIIADHGAGRVWRHYHLIGCVLRGEIERHDAGFAADLSARIEARLGAEPAVDAPPSPSPIVPLRRRAWTSAAKAGAAATLALAASLALVAVIVLRPGADSGGAGVASTNPATAPATTERVRFGAEFAEMLAQHGEFASSPGLNGLIVHAKFVNNQPLDR